MDSSGAINNDTSDMSRILYVERIIEKIESSPSLFPVSSQERFYQDGLRHLAGALSNAEVIGGRTLCDISRKTRKESLKEILSQLHEMERIRLYDPPAENELSFYQNIKRHVWSIFAFAGAKHTIDSKKVHFGDKFRYYSPFVIVPYLENFGELNKHLRDISLSVVDFDITNGSVMKPFIGMETNSEVVPMPLCTLTEKRTNMFYQHKFMLALLDLVSTHIVDSPPTGDEKRAYQNILDNALLNPSCDATTGEMSEHKHTDLDPTKLLLEQVPKMMDELVRLVRNIFDTIFIKLFIKDVSLSNLRSHSAADYECMVQEFVRNCDVPKIHLKGFVDALDEALVIAKYISSIIGGIVYGIDTLKGGVLICLEPLHALTMLNCCRKVSGDFSKLLDQFKQDAQPNCLCKRKGKMTAYKIEGSCNTKFLQDILIILRNIGYTNLNSKLDMEEIQLLDNILKNVASSVDFFFSAITYERQLEVSQHGKSPDEFRRKSGEIKKMYDFEMRNEKESCSRIYYDLLRCINLLSAYKIGLVNKASTEGFCSGLMVSEQDKYHAELLKWS